MVRMNSVDELPKWDDIQFVTAQLHRVPLLDDEQVDTSVVIGSGAGKPLHVFHNLFKRAVTVLARLSAAEQIQVRAIKDENVCHRNAPQSGSGILPDFAIFVHKIDTDSCNLEDFCSFLFQAGDLPQQLIMIQRSQVRPAHDPFSVNQYTEGQQAR